MSGKLNIKSESEKLKEGLEFTGERMIPSLNKGQTFFYEHLARYLWSCQFVQNKTVLDIGCGVGYGSSIISTLGKAKHVYGVDISKGAIRYAKQKYKTSNIDFLEDDATKLTKIKKEEVDVVIGFEIIEHLKRQDVFLQKIKYVLKPGGVLLVSTPNSLTYPKGNPFHEKELNPLSFQKLLSKYFNNIKITYQNMTFSSLIGPFMKQDFSLEENFVLIEQISYMSKMLPKDSHYIIAVCSDSSLSPHMGLSLSIPDIDGFILSSGLSSLWSLRSQINNLRSQINNLNDALISITSSKFYRLWRKYQHIKKFMRS